MSGRGAALTGRQVAGVVLVVLVVTAVLPPAAAALLNRSRIQRSEAAIERAVAAIRGRNGAPLSGVFCGPGLLPEGPPPRRSRDRSVHDQWFARARIAPTLFGGPEITDGWGRCLLVDATASSGITLVSAGADGTVDTPIGQAHTAGDDIGRRVSLH